MSKEQDGSAYGLTADDLTGDWNVLAGGKEVAKLIKKNGLFIMVNGMISDPDKNTGKCHIKILRIKEVSPN